MNELFFENSKDRDGLTSVNFWHYGALFITVAYIVFGLIFIGVPGISRGGVAAALLAAVWMVVGLATGQAKFPLSLLFAVAFYATIVISGFFLSSYPVDYIGQVTTIWVAAISIAFFVANGVSLRVIFFGFVAVFLANMAAVLVGYDGYALNVAEESLSSLEGEEIRRVSALAGQPNLLVILVFTMPFFVFLREEKLSNLMYVSLIAACAIVTGLTASRSGIPMTIIFAVFGALKLRNGPFKYLAIAFGAVSVIAVLIFLSDPSAISKIEQSEYGEMVLVERVIETIDGDEGSLDARDEIVEEGWPFFFQKPVFGYGPAMFQVLVGQGTYAHNNFVELAINWGSIGIALYYLMYVVIIFGTMHRLPQKLALLAPLIWLAIADQWFVLFLERPVALIVCLMLVLSHTKVATRRRSKRRSRKRSSGRRSSSHA